MLLPYNQYKEVTSNMHNVESLVPGFEKMLEDYGHYVVHIRKTSVLCPKCSAGNSGSGIEVNPKCDVCLGRGYSVQLLPTLVRGSVYARPDFDALMETSIGIVGPENYIYYMKRDARPLKGDLIAEVTWDSPRNKIEKQGNVLALHNIQEINLAKPYRGQHGEVVYFRVVSHTVELEESWIASVLKAKR